MNGWLESLKLEDDELVAIIESSFFNSSVEVRFIGTNELGKKQKEVVEGFIKNEEVILEQAFPLIIESYENSYPFYFEGWSYGGMSKEEIEKKLPKRMTSDKFLSLVSDLEIFVNPEESCNKGDFGLSLECEWDAENGFGIKFKNWEVQETGTSQVAFL